MNDEQRNFRPDQPKAETDDQHKAEKLAIENKMLRFVLDSIPDNISIKDLEGRYIFDNRSHCLFLGAMNTVDVVGKTLFDFLPPESRRSFMPKIFAYCDQVKKWSSLWTSQSTTPGIASGCRLRRCPCGMTRAS